MIERVVENWLTSTNERGGYEIAFRQLLAFQGHRILHKSSHGQMEQGKDIVTIAPDNVPCAYQLKAEGDISLNKWRKMKGEVDELIEIPIQHPSVANDFPNHRAYLVNNGFLKDTVRRLIHDRNRVYSQRGLPILNVIQFGDLHKDFVEIHGRFLRTEPRDFRRFLELYLIDGTALLPAGQFSAFLLSILAFGDKALKKSELKRAIASALVLANYVLSPYREAKNSVSLINGWVLVAAHVLAEATKARLPKKTWTPTFDLCIRGIEEGFKGLLSEVLSRDDFRQGEPLTDGMVYRARMTLLLGYLTAYENYLHLRGEQSEAHEAVRRLVEAQMSHLLLWSESAIPAFLSIAWFLERHNRQLLAEQLILSVVHTVVTQNGPESKVRGLADPYHSIEDVLRIGLGLDQDEINLEDFEGHSYSLQSLVEWLARRGRRQGLARLWEEISRVCYSEFIPEPSWSTYLWYSEKGHLHHRFPKKPQSWKSLVDRAQDKEFTEVPELLRHNPEFLLIFLLVYPHRMRPDFVRLLDQSFG